MGAQQALESTALSKGKHDPARQQLSSPRKLCQVCPDLVSPHESGLTESSLQLSTGSAPQPSLLPCSILLAHPSPPAVPLTPGTEHWGCPVRQQEGLEACFEQTFSLPSCAGFQRYCWTWSCSPVPEHPHVPCCSTLQAA